MSMAGQSKSLGYLFFMPKIKEPLVRKDPHFYFPIGIGKAKLLS